MTLLDTWVGFVAKIEHRIAHSAGTLAKKCALKPKTTLVVFFAICFALMGGFLVIEVETTGTKLWVDQNSIPRQQLGQVEDAFGVENRAINLIFAPKNLQEPNANVFTKAVFDEMFAIQDEVLTRKTPNGKTFQDLCAKRGDGACLIDGPMGMWFFNSSIYAAQTAVNGDLVIRQTMAQPNYPFGVPVLRNVGFSGFELNGGNATARAFAVYFFLAGEFEGELDEILAFELEIINHIVDEFDSSVVNVEIQTLRSIDDELQRNTSNDVYLMAIAFSIMITFASFTLGKPFSRLEGKSAVAQTDVWLVLFSGLAAAGFMMYIGIPYQQLVSILPFLLIGIGIDNAYVMVAGYSRTDPSKPVEERMYETSYTSGMSITVTTLTNVVALLFGSQTKLPAVKWFCYYSAGAFFFAYIAHLTAFVAVLTLDQQRKDAKRMDLFCCIKVSEEEAKKEEEEERKPHRVQHFFYEVYAPFLLKPVVKVIVILIFAAAVGVSGWLATQITIEFDLSLLTPDDSYLKDFYTTSQELFGSTASGRIPTSLYVQDVDYSSYQVQEEIERLANEILAAESIDETLGKTDWLAEFTEWANVTLPHKNYFSADKRYLIGANFTTSLLAFLQDFPRFNSDLVFDGQGNIVYSKITFSHVVLSKATDSIDALEEMQAIYEGSSLNPKPFIVFFSYEFWDQFRIILPEMIQTLAFSLVAVLIICTVMLVHPMSVAIAAVFIAMILVDLLGSLVLWGLDLNSVSAINLVMALGLVIDYSAHILHYFGTLSPSLSRDERVKETLKEMGSPVFMGMMTTFLGIIALSGTSSEIFRTFFKLFLTIVLVGGAHGLILLPVVLSLIGPSIVREKDEDKSSKVAAASL